MIIMKMIIMKYNRENTGSCSSRKKKFSPVVTFIRYSLLSGTKLLHRFLRFSGF